MILPIYLSKKFVKSSIICIALSFSIFFIFSLIGNLGEKLSFKSIFLLSTLNSFQIFTFIPSHLFILSLCLFIFHLKSRNELIIIKEYIELRNLFLLIVPIVAFFVLIEIKKDNFSSNIEKIKSNIINSKNEDTKILISSDGSKKNYIILNGYDKDNNIVNQYLSFETQNQKIYKGEISTNLDLKQNNLISIDSIIYQNNHFQNENIEKKLIGNFTKYWSANSGTIIKNRDSKINSKYDFIQSIIFNCLFYYCISIIFFSKRIVNRDMNTFKIFLLVLSLFLYFLLIPKVMLNKFQYVFQFFSIIILILSFFKFKQYE